MSLVSEHFRDGENPVLVGEQGRHLTMSALKLVGEYFHIFSEKGLFDFEGLGEYSINIKRNRARPQRLGKNLPQLQ